MLFSQKRQILFLIPIMQVFPLLFIVKLYYALIAPPLINDCRYHNIFQKYCIITSFTVNLSISNYELRLEQNYVLSLQYVRPAKPRTKCRFSPLRYKTLSLTSRITIRSLDSSILILSPVSCVLCLVAKPMIITSSSGIRNRIVFHRHHRLWSLFPVQQPLAHPHRLGRCSFQNQQSLPLRHL